MVSLKRIYGILLRDDVSISKGIVGKGILS